MARTEPNQDAGGGIVLLLSVLIGVVGVVASLFAFRVLGSPQSTPEAELARVGSFMLWTQPFIYLASGLLAGVRGGRWGPVRAPVIGLFLAGLCWFLLRHQGLLPSQPNILAWLLPAGALFALLGAVVAPLLRDHVGTVIAALAVLGVLAFICAYVNLGGLAGQVRREVIQRVNGMTTAMIPTPVPNARVELLADPEGPVLYTTKTNSSGRFLFSGLPLKQFTLRIWDPATPAVITDQVQVRRALAGGTWWTPINLPPLTVESGELFR